MANSIQFLGFIKQVSPVQTGTSASGKNWEKQTIVIEEQGEHPASVVIEAFNKPDEVAKCKVGNEVKAHLNLRANEYQGKWYQKVDLWRVEIITMHPAHTEPVQQDQRPVAQFNPSVPQASQSADQQSAAPQGKDDLPF